MMRRGNVGSARARLARWIEEYCHPDMIQRAVELPLRRDMVTLLQYVRENKIVGTQSTGNLPLKAVRAVTQQFVNPPELDQKIGDRVYRLRSETDVWSLYFLHILAEVAGLVVTAPGQPWRVTAYGESFLSMDPLLQVSFLLIVWWYQVNWLVAYPFEGMGESLPKGFQQAVLARLRGLPVGERIEFEEFANGLIRETGLKWGAQVDSAQMLLHGSIQQMVIHILANFGALEREYQEVPLGRGTISRLVAFAVTPFGKALLEAVGVMAG